MRKIDKDTIDGLNNTMKNYKKEINFLLKNRDKVDGFFKNYKPHKSENFKRNKMLFYAHVYEGKGYGLLGKNNDMQKQRVLDVVRRYINRIYYHFI